MKSKKNQGLKPTNSMLIFIFILVAILLLFTTMYFYFRSKKQLSLHYQTTSSLVTSEQEKRRIDQWIEERNLNEYGDPKGTAYAGGTPLFNEATGKYKNRYDHIVKHYPERPWNK